MMSLTFGLFTQVSGSGPLGPLVFRKGNPLPGHYRVNQRIAASRSRSSVTDK